MKKLMTVIASVALAFGLHAADDFKFNQTDFSGMPIGPFNINMDDSGGEQGTLYWAGDAGDSEIKAVSEEAVGAKKFLSIENSAPLYRTVNGQTADPQEIGTGVFADMNVKFTASDAADPVVLADGSKLGIWVAADDEAETPTTNLMVCAASLVNGAKVPVATNFTIAVADDFDFKAEHRVTIRAIEEISEGKLEMAGFVLYIDEKLVAAADADYAEKVGFDAFNGVAKPFYDNNQLFVSLIPAGDIGAQTIFGVGFKGTGELSKVALADADHAPDFAKPAVDVTFAWADGVESFTYQGIATNVGGKAGSVVVTLAGPTVPVTLSGVTASDGYVLGDIEAEGLDEVEDGVWSYKDAPASLTMTAGEVAFTIDDQKFATFEDALAAAQPGDIIKLAKDCVWTGEVEINVGEDNEITLDLAGKTISAEDYDDYDLFYITGGKLTIIDSVGGGKIAVTGAEESSYTGIIYGNGGEAQIGLDSDDADKGVVVDALIGDEAGDLKILKGQFLKEANDEGDLVNYIDETEYKVVDADDYWKVQKQGGPEPIFVIEIVETEVKYETIDAALADAEDGQTLLLLKDVELDACVKINKEITFILGGCTLSAPTSGVFDVYSSLTVTDGDITTGKWGIWANSGASVSMACGVTLTCSGGPSNAPGIIADANTKVEVLGTITLEDTDAAAISGIGNEENAGAEITIGGTAKIVSSGTGIYFPTKDGVLTISDFAEITADDNALEVKAGTVTIGKAEIESKTAIADATSVKNTDGTSAKGYALAIVENKAYADNISITIDEGAKIAGKVGIVLDDLDAPDPTSIVIANGALFTDKDGAATLIDDATQQMAEKADEDGYFAVEEKKPDYPSDWPDADEDIKGKFAAWRAGPGADAELDTDAAKNAFLLNCSVEDITDLRIESIKVDADGTVKFMVGCAPGFGGFPGPDLRNVNGVLFAKAGETLDKMEDKKVTWMWDTITGKMAGEIKANFVRVIIGFKAPSAE